MINVDGDDDTRLARAYRALLKTNEDVKEAMHQLEMCQVEFAAATLEESEKRNKSCD